MPLLTPPPSAPARGDRTTFAARVDAFIAWLINFVTELVALVSGLNTLASGTAYSIPYKFSTATTDSDPGIWWLRLDNVTQNASAVIRVSTTGSDGKSYATILDTLDDSTSVVKGALTLQCVSDPSKFLQFNVTGLIGSGSYRNITVSCIGGSAVSPFTASDVLVLKFSRTGDQGATGPTGPIRNVPYMKVSDVKAPGTQGGAGSTGVTPNVRTLNTVDANTITGASLASNQITLPAGTYRVRASAPAAFVYGHKAILRNVTDGVNTLVGTKEFSGAESNGTFPHTTRSQISGTFTITSAKVFSIYHFIQVSSGSNDLGANNGSLGDTANDVFTVVEIEQVG